MSRKAEEAEQIIASEGNRQSAKVLDKTDWILPAYGEWNAVKV